MASKDPTSLAADKSITMPNFSLGQEQTEAAAALQKELLGASAIGGASSTSLRHTGS
jgi:hypothetical protein